MSFKKLVLKQNLAPGDTLVMTAAVRDLRRVLPPDIEIGVDTTAMQLWENNPYINPKLSTRTPGVRKLAVEYTGSYKNQNTRDDHFIQAMPRFLERQLGIDIPVTALKGDIHLASWEVQEKSQVERETGYAGPYWLVNCGGKSDFTAKWPNPEHFQAVVNHFRGRIKFVQVGRQGSPPGSNLQHFQWPLEHTLSLVNKTDIRQLIRVVYHSQGVLSGITFLMHLAAAVPTKTGQPRPAVVIAGGRESVQWEKYPNHEFLHTIGELPCCQNGGCLKVRCQPMRDGHRRDNPDRLCERPIQIHQDLRIAECMQMITPGKVIEAIERQLAGPVRTDKFSYA